MSEKPSTMRYEDSDAWLRKAHEVGTKVVEAHRNDEGTANSADLRKLAHALFDPRDESLSKLQRLQTELRDVFGMRSQEKGPPTGEEGVKQLNAWLKENCGVTLSHAQLVCLWHMLVDQEDLRLLSPWDPTRGW